MGPVDAAGWVTGVARVPSPFRDARPAASTIDLLVLHNISLPPGVFGTGDIARLFVGQLDAGAHPFFMDLAGARVSAHFVIDRTGAVIQFVPTVERAWHAGRSTFDGRDACNDFSIGIELEGTDFTPFTDAQYGALVRLISVLQAAHPLRAIRGHSDIARDRKTDPGPCFDWARLRAGGIATGLLAPARRA
jgi:N-acetyl-anhydromuramoyl-L-alanine amidase